MEIKNKNITFMEVFFVIICLLCIFVFKSFMIAIVCILSLLPVILLKNHMINYNINIRKKKNFLYAFIIIFIAYMGIQLFYKYGLDYINTMDQYTLNQHRLFFQLPLTITIFLGYLFKIRLTDFNWSITLKNFSIVVLIFVPFLILINIKTLIENTMNYYYMRNFIQQLYYPGIVEEVVFRGFLLSGLLAFEVREDKANIIQSVIFGLIHIINYNEISAIIVLSTCLQMYIGFLFGKIYLQTKSLTPCILLHALIDMI